MSFLSVNDLVCRYGDRVAVDHLSFAVERGEIFGLLGPNGAGKSTVFQVLSGLLRPASGQLLLGREAFTPTDPQQRRRLGVVFQDPSLDDQLTGRENLQLLAALHGLSGSLGGARIDEALRLLELGDRQHDRVLTYSGGMKRRLELGRVLLHRPDVLLMDEPSRGLDAASLRRYWGQLLSWQKQWGLTILLTTHQPEEAEYCHRIAVLDRGRLHACDTPENLRKRVGGDVITIEAEGALEIAAELQRRWASAIPPIQLVQKDEGQLVLLYPRAHELIPRLVESFPQGRLRSVAMRRPSLGDVFVKMTGRMLEDLGPPPAGERERVN